MIADILIVDDENDIRELVSGILQDEGYLTRTARDSDDALAAVAAIKQGAYDFIEKPFKADRLVLVAERALEMSRLKREVRALKQLAPLPTTLIGHSPSIN